MIFRLEFVTHVPEKMEEGVLYISIPFSTTMHLCACGCKNQIVNKLSPARWKLTYDGETASLSPSVGNWSLPCQSHYWITKNQIKWAESWSPEKISKVRKTDQKANEKYQNKKRKG
jgi:hypothetical protein